MGGRSLEKENQFLETDHERIGEIGGLLRVKLDCYYQYVFGRATFAKYDAQLQS